MRQASQWIVGMAVAALVTMAAPVFAGFSGTDLFLPSVGNRPGALSSNWHTLVWVYNPGAATANITVYFLERDVSTATPPSAPLIVGPGQTFRSASIIEDLFGFQKWGALRFTSASDIVVTCRMYNLPASATDANTQGQDYSGIPASFAIGAGESTQLLGGSQLTPVTSGTFRYSFGWTETTGHSANVRVTAYDSSGALAGGPKDYPATDAWESRYYPIDDLIPNVNSTNLRLKVEVTGGSGKIIAVGSGVANTSNDGTTFEMQFADSLLNAGLTAVAHDATLTGDGSTGSPLGVANAGITKAKLNASGGSAGQVLGTDGSNLVWQTPSSFTLPYDDSASSGGVVFNIKNTSSGIGIKGESAGSMYGVYGVSATGHGVRGFSNSSSGTGVSGGAGGTSGLSPTPGVGVWGDSHDGTGVYGTSAAKPGVYGLTSGTGTLGYAVGGNHTNGNFGYIGGSTNAMYASANTGFGLRASTGDNTKYGVYGLQGAASGTYDSNTRGGVWGDSTNGQGVLGTSKNSVGVAGQSLGHYGVQGLAIGGGSSGVGVIGFTSSGASWAGYFSGNVNVTGSLSKSSGSFKIDDPLDPEHKYLYHSFVESPDMMNVYNGNVTTDGIGEAMVTMPEYFSALNRDFRYQLTVIGQFAQAIVQREIENNVFVIKTDKPYVKVSWQVTGVRKDPWAEAHRIQVEEVKPAAEQGTYIHPELYGQPPEMGVEWARDPHTMEMIKELSDKFAQQPQQ
jgi:hypothetical protein